MINTYHHHLPHLPQPRHPPTGGGSWPRPRHVLPALPPSPLRRRLNSRRAGHSRWQRQSPRSTRRPRPPVARQTTRAWRGGGAHVRRPEKIRGAVTRLRRVVRLPVSTVEPCRAERGPLTRRETPGFKNGDIKQNNYKKKSKIN